MDHSLETIDWTAELLHDKTLKRFKNRVVWPSINLLYRKEHNSDFLIANNLGEEFDLVENIHTPEGDMLIRISLEAKCVDEGTDPAEFTPVGTATIKLDERRIEDEGYLLPGYSDLQIWRSRSYFFNTNSQKPLVWVDSYHLLKHPEMGVVEQLSDSEEGALKYLGDDFEMEVLSKQDCIEIGNMFVMLGVQESLIDERMRRFNRRSRIR